MEKASREVAHISSAHLLLGKFLIGENIGMQRDWKKQPLAGDWRLTS